MIRRLHAQVIRQELSLNYMGFAEQLVQDVMYQGLGTVMGYLLSEDFKKHNEEMFEEWSLFDHIVFGKVHWDFRFCEELSTESNNSPASVEH